MNKITIIQFIRAFLSKGIDYLNRVEQRFPRAHKDPWYRIELRLPSPIVAVVSGIFLYGVLFFGIKPTLLNITALSIFVLMVVLLFVVYLIRDHRDIVKNGDAMALLGIVFCGTVVLIKVISIYSQKYAWLSPYATPVSVGPLLAALLLHQRIGMVLAFLLAFIAGVINDFSLPVALVSAIGGVTIVAAGSQARSAHQIARAGLLAGLAQLLMVVFVFLMDGWTPRASLIAVGGAFFSGVISAVFSLGVLPYLESFFSRISNLRLVELAAINHPLLRQMSIQAPGTYHHSLIVAALAEDAANAIGANGLLCRVGAYFHDIGKIVKAEYFIENQGTFGNPHDEVNPSLSRLVITSHVKEGMALARAYKLDPQVMEFIPQHHGTSKIEYFYHKALKQEEDEEEDAKEEVSEETYRYPGPKPQTKETSIVMLADSVEATSRTLEEPNHQRFNDLVKRIINKKLADGQLENTPLTLRDLHIIEERFTATLTSLYHARIPYPEMAEKSRKEKEDELASNS